MAEKRSRRSRSRPTEAIKDSRARAAGYFDQARTARGAVVPEIKRRIGNELAAKAIGLEMGIASRVAKGQLTRAAKEAAAMATVAERLGSLKKAQLQAVAREVGIAFNSKTTAAKLRADIDKRIVEHARFDAKNAVAKQANAWGGDPFAAKFDQRQVTSAAAGARAAMEAKINAAIDKTTAGVPAKAAKVKAAGIANSPVTNPGKAPRSDPQPTTKVSRSKSNPALVQHLAKRFDAVFAMPTGALDHGNAATNAELAKAKAAALTALEQELKGAKLSRADAHALAERTGTPVTRSASGKAAVESVARRIVNLEDHVRKIIHFGGRTAAALGPVLMPVAAVALASMAFSSESHAAEARGDDRTAARAKAATEAAKAVTDLLAFGAGEATKKALDAGKSRGEAVAIGLAKGAINMATMGVPDMANDALADKGGVSGTISSTVTRAAGKVAELLGWPGDSQANLDVRHADASGGAGSGALQVANGAGYAVAGHMVVKNAKSLGMPRMVKGSAHAMRATGLLIAAHGLAELVVGTGKQAAPQGKAYLNENAAQRAAEPPKPVAPLPVVAAAARQHRSDGQTEGYTRRTQTGLTVQVKGYRTPTRR